MNSNIAIASFQDEEGGLMLEDITSFISTGK